MRDLGSIADEKQNFYSTVFVNQDTDSNDIVISSEAWVYAAIAVPLTLGTLFLWWAWVRLQLPVESHFRFLWRLRWLYPLNKHRARVAEDNTQMVEL